MCIDSILKASKQYFNPVETNALIRHRLTCWRKVKEKKRLDFYLCIPILKKK